MLPAYIIVIDEKKTIEDYNKQQKIQNTIKPTPPMLNPEWKEGSQSGPSSPSLPLDPNEIPVYTPDTPKPMGRDNTTILNVLTVQRPIAGSVPKPASPPTSPRETSPRGISNATPASPQKREVTSLDVMPLTPVPPKLIRSLTQELDTGYDASAFLTFGETPGTNVTVNNLITDVTYHKPFHASNQLIASSPQSAVPPNQANTPGPFQNSLFQPGFQPTPPGGPILPRPPSVRLSPSHL